ncbi:hemicentin-2-like [Cydia amplana]|uniref:hemicentin-2-like n=1 Tax=Cydia amplana TaxID=1869771 RepID=UPI002FE5A4F8
MEGSRVTLPCRADGSPRPSITWIYHSRDIEVGPSRIRPSDDTGRLSFDRIQLRQNGEYTCVASNSRSSKNITYEVSVLATPKIYYTTKEFHGVVGDMVLRIPCNATGNPKPEITWTMEGYYIASGTKWYEISEDGSLIIKNIKELSAGYYSCKASNDYGQAEEGFDVIVDDFPDPGFRINKFKLNKGDSAMIPCNIPRKKTDRLLWFKDGRLLPSSDLAFRVLTESGSGTYTCRVSSMDRPAMSGSTTVEVGYKPRFEYSDYNKDISFVPGEFATMDCTATGFPKPKVQWYHNNRPISLNNFKYVLGMYSDYVKGRYTCVVSNSYGTVQREFVVSSFGCLLNVKHDFSKNEPLMLTSDNKLTNFKTNGGYMRIPKDDTIKLVCPSSFITIPLREILVTCENAQQFLHQSSGRRYAYSDLKCSDKWQPIVKRTGRRCARRKAEILNVGYEIGKIFETVYEVCLARDSKNPIYTKLNMQPSLANSVTNNDTVWFNYGSPVDLDGLYDCSNQNTETSAILNKEFHRGDGCCFAKRMLLNPLDVAPGLQDATYTHLNVVPHWSTCNSKNWDEVERRIRNLVTSSDRTLQVFTGTAYNLQLTDSFSRQRNVVLKSRGKGVQVPRYLWKVVQNPSTETSLAIIQVNVPHLSLASVRSYQLCNDVCKNVKWMQTGNWRSVRHGFTYCCSLADFERAFRFKMEVKIYFIILGLFLLGIDGTVGDVKSSLTFVIDDTGSMGNDIAQVKIGANAIFDTVMRSNSSQIEDFVLVTFNDPANMNKLRAKTKERNVFKNALIGIRVYGGGDCPEMAMSGIKMGLQNSREGSSIYVFTDASAKDYNDYDEIEALSQKMGCQIVFVLTGYCSNKKAPQYLVYKKLAKATNGQVFHLEKSEIREILKYVQKTIESRNNVLKSKDFPPGYGNTFDIPVDADTKELVIAVSGRNPAVSVTDSGGTKWPTTNITRLKEIAVVKVVGVTPDVYTVEVGSEDETHVVVSGSSTVHFQHGFSTVSPSDIKDTVTRPVPGVKSHLSIKLSTDGGNIALHSVQILDMNDNVISTIPLKLVDKTEQFYTTEQIMPPDHMFKVAINGYDFNNKALITRISLTPVKPQEIRPAKVETKAPVVECKDIVNAVYDKALQLKCKISGYPKPDVIWESDDKSVVLSHFESTIELPYDYISVLEISNVTKNSTYTCKAVNSVGSGEGRTTVQTKIKSYFKVLAFPRDITIEYQKSVKIPCKVEAYPPANATWYKGRKPLKPDGNLELSEDGSVLTIRSMEPNMADNYICEARNARKRKIYPFTVQISGVEAPEISKEVTEITALKGSAVDIRCQVTKGKPQPRMHWYYKSAAANDYPPMNETSDTIHLENIDATHTGSYRCVADNVMHWDSHEIDLIVEYKPSISRPRQSIMTTDLGEPVTLPCPAIGEPTPTITWKLNGVPIPSTARYSIFADGTLRFLAASSDEGEYECEASNTRGVDSIKYKLNVYVPVDIESPKNSFLQQMEGSMVTLPCRADGSPKPSLTWIYRSRDAKVRPSRLEPSDATGRLQFDRILLRQGGEYTCVATNSRGSKNITYEVEVLAPPKIYYTAKEFQGVVGDMQLLIPCNATGNPKPDITWEMGPYHIASGSEWFDISAEGSLIIKNVDKASSRVYTCKASNDYGQTQEDFGVVVDDFLDPGFITNEFKLKEGESAMIPCSVPHKKTDRILWFKNGERLPSSDLVLHDVTESDSGTYTCRVSSVDRPAQSDSTRVEVGFEPRFDYPDDEKNIAFKYGELATMDCTATGVPEPKVKWYHDDREISLKEYRYDLEMYNDNDKGRYTCVVSNSYGTAKQEFVISSFECLLDVTRFSKNDPLMLTLYNKVPNFKTSGVYMRIPKDEKIKLVCPSYFKPMSLREMIVTCEKEQQFLHDLSGRHFAYSDFKCREMWQPIAKRTGRRCAKGKAEILNVGFETRATFQTVYEVCLDQDSKNPIYTKLDMQPSLANSVTNNDTVWFNYGSPVDLDGLYDCANQNGETSAILNKEFHRGDGCCFAKRMLVNPMDVAPGLQGATYTHLNVAPHWGTCDSKNWEEVERRVRNLVTSSDRTLQVFTGTANDLELPDAYSRQKNVVLHSRGKDVQVPRYLWKIVQDPTTETSLVIIQVNVPDLKLAEAHSYQLCKDICKNAEWMVQYRHWRNVHHGFTYCCSLADFERAFRYQGVFPDFKNLLLEVSDLPDDHYLHAA